MHGQFDDHQRRDQAQTDERHEICDHLSIRKQLCSLHYLFGQVLNELAALHPKVRIRFRPLGQTCDGLCHLDPNQIRRVFQILVVNSLAYCSGLLLIELEISDVRLGKTPALELRYSDLSAGPLNHVMANLILLRRIIEAHGGRLDVGSAQRTSVNSTITLPRFRV